MRIAFAKALANLAEQDSRIILLTGDLGYMALEPFSERFPSRFFNVGVAEQNMVGVATGLAEAGFIPFAYSIATFASLRPYEFIRNGAVLHNMPVRIVAVGGGFEYGAAGPTHHALEDLAVMRVQPNLTVIAPADHQQTTAALNATWNLGGPIYYRLGKDDKSVVPGLNGRFALGAVDVARQGDDVLLLSVGAISSEACAAAEALQARDVSAAVAIVSTINPCPKRSLVELISRFPLVLTIEAHYVVGGLGSMVSEIVAEEALACRVVRCGVKELSRGTTGGQKYLQSLHGLSSDELIKSTLLHIDQHKRRNANVS